MAKATVDKFEDKGFYGVRYEANLILPLFRRPQFCKTSAVNGRGGDCAHEAGLR